MRIVLINILKKNIESSIKLREKYKLTEPMYHVITGRIEAYNGILELLKEEIQKWNVGINQLEW